MVMICDENQREGKRVKGRGTSVAATTREGHCRNLVENEHIVHIFSCLCWYIGFPSSFVHLDQTKFCEFDVRWACAGGDTRADDW